MDLVDAKVFQSRRHKVGSKRSKEKASYSAMHGATVSPSEATQLPLYVTTENLKYSCPFLVLLPRS